MMYTVRFHPLVKQDHEKVYEWYESREEDLGERFLKAVRMKIEAIALHPEYYSYKSNLSFREVRTDIFPYIIVYKISKQQKEIYISSVHHAKKRPQRKYRKD